MKPELNTGDRRSLSRILTDAGGVTAVEFSMLALPLFSLIFMIFDQGILFFKSEALQTAISDSSRLIATGQAASANYTAEQFRQQICARLPPILSCSSVAVDVRTYASFASASRFRPFDANGNYTPGSTTYSPGVQGSIVVVTGFSLQHALFPMMTLYFNSAGNGQVVLSAAAAFRNEPY